MINYVYIHTARYMYGLVPQALLDAYTFWRDESKGPAVSGKDPSQSSGYQRLMGYPRADDGDFMVIIELRYGATIPGIAPGGPGLVTGSGTRPQVAVLQCTGLPGRSVNVVRKSRKAMIENFKRRQKLAGVIEKFCLLSEDKKPGGKETGGRDITAATAFKIDDEVEVDYEGKDVFWPCRVLKMNDDGSYDVEFEGEQKYMGKKRGIYPDLIQKRGEAEKKKQISQLWNWDGISESDEEDLRLDDEDAVNMDGGEAHVQRDQKDSLCFDHFNQLDCVLHDGAGGNTELCCEILAELGRVRGVKGFSSVSKLAAAVAERAAARRSSNGQAGGATASPLASIAAAASHKASMEDEDEEMILLNLLYAPRGSRLHSILRVLSRVENASHICAWSSARKLPVSFVQCN